MNVLSEAARAILAEVRPRQPFFSNQVLAELFDQHHTRGPYKLLPFAEGGYVVFDTRITPLSTRRTPRSCGSPTPIECSS